jgi:hypothetical protein
VNRCRPPEARERRRKSCLHSVDSGVAPHHRSPASAMKPARHDLWAPFGREAIEHLARAMRLSPPRSFHVLDAERQASFGYEGGHLPSRRLAPTAVGAARTATCHRSPHHCGRRREQRGTLELCLLCLRPSNRLVTGCPLLLVHIRLNQARIDRKRFAANQPSRDAHRHQALTAYSIFSHCCLKFPDGSRTLTGAAWGVYRRSDCGVHEVGAGSRRFSAWSSRCCEYLGTLSVP